MAGNKVKYSDLIQDDGALDRLLDKLEQTATTFEGLVSTAKSSARDISNSLNSMSSATQAGRDSILAANAAVANLKSATAQLKVSISDTSQPGIFPVAILHMASRCAKSLILPTALCGGAQLGTHSTRSLKFNANTRRASISCPGCGGSNAPPRKAMRFPVKAFSFNTVKISA